MLLGTALAFGAEIGGGGGMLGDGGDCRGLVRAFGNARKAKE